MLRYVCLFGLLIFGASGVAQNCASESPSQAASRALALQHTLLSTSVEDLDTDVPAQLKPALHDFKQALIATAELGLVCNPRMTDPARLQAGLAAVLHANRPQAPAAASPRPATQAGGPERDTGIYGGGLTVAVRAVPGQADLVSIEMAYSIECGGDNLLLLFRRTASGWRRELLYANPDLNQVGDAFGDFFIWSLVPGPGGKPLLAAAHGTPWCTSRESELHVDLIAPASDAGPQKTLAHLDHGYSRDDQVPAALKPMPEGFQFRALDDSLDFDNLFTRPRVYRFRTSGGTLERMQPIADNARDFVDAWMQLPWPEAARWAVNPSPAMKAVRHRFDYNLVKSRPELQFGPVLACGGMRFQVEMDLSEDDRDSKLFAQVRREPAEFLLVSFAPQPDAACKGPDLMAKPGKK